mgnify:CR=1 FL=1
MRKKKALTQRLNVTIPMDIYLKIKPLDINISERITEILAFQLAVKNSENKEKVEIIGQIKKNKEQYEKLRGKISSLELKIEIIRMNGLDIQSIILFVILGMVIWFVAHLI